MNTKKVYQKLKEENEEARKLIYELLLRCNTLKLFATYIYDNKGLNENIERAERFLKKESIYE
jgi:hypothetical protein